jgi:hypothetical protein
VGVAKELWSESARNGSVEIGGYLDERIRNAYTQADDAMDGHVPYRFRGQAQAECHRILRETATWVAQIEAAAPA